MSNSLSLSLCVPGVGDRVPSGCQDLPGGTQTTGTVRKGANESQGQDLLVALLFSSTSKNCEIIVNKNFLIIFFLFLWKLGEKRR